jgi:hypothetical protein
MLNSKSAAAHREKSGTMNSSCVLTSSVQLLVVPVHPLGSEVLQVILASQVPVIIAAATSMSTSGQLKVQLESKICKLQPAEQRRVDTQEADLAS